MEHSGYLKAAQSAITHVKGNVRYHSINTAAAGFATPSRRIRKCWLDSTPKSRER